jgi:hypothetical protein
MAPTVVTVVVPVVGAVPHWLNSFPLNSRTKNKQHVTSTGLIGVPGIIVF